MLENAMSSITTNNLPKLLGVLAYVPMISKLTHELKKGRL
jgi:hypothetical protein